MGGNGVVPLSSVATAAAAPKLGSLCVGRLNRNPAPVFVPEDPTLSSGEWPAECIERLLIAAASDAMHCCVCSSPTVIPAALRRAKTVHDQQDQQGCLVSCPDWTQGAAAETLRRWQQLPSEVQGAIEVEAEQGVAVSVADLTSRQADGRCASGGYGSQGGEQRTGANEMRLQTGQLSDRKVKQSSRSCNKGAPAKPSALCKAHAPTTRKVKFCAARLCDMFSCRGDCAHHDTRDIGLTQEEQSRSFLQAAVLPERRVLCSRRGGDSSSTGNSHNSCSDSGGGAIVQRSAQLSVLRAIDASLTVRKLLRLLCGGVDINCRNECGQSAVALAAWTGNVPAVALLLSLGADVHSLDHCGCSTKDLLQQGGDRSAYRDAYGNSDRGGSLKGGGHADYVLVDMDTLSSAAANGYSTALDAPDEGLFSLCGARFVIQLQRYSTTARHSSCSSDGRGVRSAAGMDMIPPDLSLDRVYVHVLIPALSRLEASESTGVHSACRIGLQGVGGIGLMRAEEDPITIQHAQPAQQSSAAVVAMRSFVEVHGPSLCAGASGGALVVDGAFSAHFLQQLRDLHGRRVPEAASCKPLCATRSFFCDVRGGICATIEAVLRAALPCTDMDYDPHLGASQAVSTSQKRRGGGEEEDDDDGDGDDEGGISTEVEVLPQMRFLHYKQSGSALEPHVDLSRSDHVLHEVPGGPVRSVEKRRSTHTLIVYLSDCIGHGQTALLTDVDRDRFSADLAMLSKGQGIDTVFQQGVDGGVGGVGVGGGVGFGSDVDVGVGGARALLRGEVAHVEPRLGRLLLFPHGCPHAALPTRGHSYHSSSSSSLVGAGGQEGYSTKLLLRGEVFVSKASC